MKIISESICIDQTARTSVISLLCICHYTLGLGHNTKGKLHVESQLLHEHKINITQGCDVSLVN